MSQTTAAGARTAEKLLEYIEEEAAEKFRFADDQCWNCDGDGYVYSCFEEYACVDPESGCEECAQRCPECASLKRDRLRYVRETVIQSNDIELAKAWLRSIGRWSDEYTDAQIKSEMLKAGALIAASKEADHA